MKKEMRLTRVFKEEAKRFRLAGNKAKKLLAAVERTVANMKKITLTLLILLSAALVFAGCGAPRETEAESVAGASAALTGYEDGQNIDEDSGVLETSEEEPVSESQPAVSSADSGTKSSSAAPAQKKASEPAAAASGKSVAQIEKDLRELGLQQVGKPYVLGGASPAAGFDCSGICYYLLKTAAGVTPPRTHEEQTGGKYGRAVPDGGEVHIGDLCETEKGLAIYIGNGEALYSWDTVQKFKVAMVLSAFRYISADGTHTDANPTVESDPFNQKKTAEQIRSVAIGYSSPDPHVNALFYPFQAVTRLELRLRDGDIRLSAQTDPYNDNISSVYWETDNPDVAGFIYPDSFTQPDGAVQFLDVVIKSAGTATIKVTAKNGMTAYCTLVIGE